MSTFRCWSVRRAMAVTVLCATAASAAVESSCPAPCEVPPKSALFVRETAGVLIAFNGQTVPLEGTLRAGTRKTVLRVDGSVSVEVTPAIQNFYIHLRLNGYYVPDIGIRTTTCDSSRAYLCTVSGTFWVDMDVMEAAHPGEFVGQPVTISLQGGNFFSQGAGQPYTASFAAEVVKKK